jgi:4-hydroxy 2-oxovalerate aldolase
MLKTLSPTILDCTLRDGSYAINFQFTAADTRIIAGELDAIDVPFIEIGHGVGLGASLNGYGEAAETDLNYLQAAAQTVRRGKFGMFCIPGITKLDDLSMAADQGMGFVRIGTEVQEVEASAPFVERAKKLGLVVMSNFMKSYAISPKAFAQKALLSVSYGSELVYLVDSSGGMTPNEVADYVRAVREVSSIPLGFHGHNNLGLAVANSLCALEEGVTLIDSSLQGLGRSAGNAATEILAVLMRRLGHLPNINYLALMDISEKFVRPLVHRRGISSLDVICGAAQFHSSYMRIIRKFSSQYGVDPRKLILRLTEQTKTSAPSELVAKIAKQISQEAEEVFTARFEFDEYHGEEQK